MLINDSREAIAVVFWFCLGRAYRKRGFREWDPETVLCKWRNAHTHTHMRCKDSHVVLWGRKLICQRPFRGSQNTWTGPVSVSTARCSPLTCSAYILACAVLCLLFRCCCFYCCCPCVNTYNMITHLISTCRLETLRREQVEREERSCPQTDTCVCVCVCECVFAWVCVEGANCAWRGLLWFSASTAPSPSTNTYSNPYVKRAAHLFAFSLRQTLVGYAHLREPREPRQENREPCAVCDPQQ